jgi:hypothetical protein
MDRENRLVEIELKTCQFPEPELTNNSAASREVKSVPWGGMVRRTKVTREGDGKPP